MANGKTSLAVLKRDIDYLKESQGEIKQDVKEIKNILINGSGKISELRGNVASLKWIFGTAIAIIGLAVSAIALYK